MRQIIVSGSILTDFCKNVRTYERLGWKMASDVIWQNDGPYHVFMRISEYGFARIKLIAAFLAIKELVTKRGGDPLYFLCSTDKSIIRI